MKYEVKTSWIYPGGLLKGCVALIDFPGMNTFA